MEFPRHTPASLTAHVIFILSCCAIQAHAISLDDAVNAQLETLPGSGPCGRLLNAGGDPRDKLLTICSRAVPVGATPTTSGGGSATPAVTPQSTARVPKDSLTAEQGVLSIARDWSLFFTAEQENLKRNPSDTEGAFDSNLRRLRLGGTYAFSSNLDLSLALDTTQHKGDFDNGGTFRFDSMGLRVLSRFHPSDAFSVHLVAAYDDVTAARQRMAQFSDMVNGSAIFSVAGAAETDYGFSQFALSIGGSYEFTAGRLNWSPQFGLDWIYSDYGTYREWGDAGLELTFYNDERTSLQSAAGLQGAYAISTSYGVILPQLSLTWRHEFHDNPRTIYVAFVDDANATQFQYQTEALDSNFFELSVGSVFVFKGGVQTFINVQTLLGNDLYESWIASLGLRIEL